MTGVQTCALPILTVASGDIPDIMVSTYRDDMMKVAEQGTFAVLNDYIDQYLSLIHISLRLAIGKWRRWFMKDILAPAVRKGIF